MARSAVWVMERAAWTTHRLAAICAARPWNWMVGLPLGSRTTSISNQLTPWLMPVPRAFAPASLAAKRAAKLSADVALASGSRPVPRRCKRGRESGCHSGPWTAGCAQSLPDRFRSRGSCCLSSYIILLLLRLWPFRLAGSDVESWPRKGWPAHLQLPVDRTAGPL